jgi:hypothetical protein
MGWHTGAGRRYDGDCGAAAIRAANTEGSGETETQSGSERLLSDWRNGDIKPRSLAALGMTIWSEAAQPSLRLAAVLGYTDFFLFA